MLKKYEKIIERYKLWHPSLYDKTLECRPSGKYSILASLDDGTKIEFNATDNTIQDVTKFYICDSTNYVDEENWRKEFGYKLRRIISEKGISQEKLSSLSGISRQMLTRYIRGISTPSSYTLTRLSEILDCDIRELTKFGYIDKG